MTSHSAVPLRTVILTGGNSGLGYVCARALARSDTHVSLILASHRQQAAQAVKALKRETDHRAEEEPDREAAHLNLAGELQSPYEEMQVPYPEMPPMEQQ